MIGDLDKALRTLIVEALPGLFGGGAPPVQLSVTTDLLSIDPQSAEATAGEPRADSRTDQLAFDPNAPAGPYTLSQQPSSGQRRIYLMKRGGDLIELKDNEIVWSKTDPQVFTLKLRSNRDIADVNHVQVSYQVTAVYTTLKATQNLDLQIQSSDPRLLEQAEALVVAVLTLNREHLIAQAKQSYTSDDYGAEVAVKRLKLLKGNGPAVGARLISMQAELDLKVTRALQPDEGRPIARISTPGRQSGRPINIDIGVET